MARFLGWLTAALLVVGLALIATVQAHVEEICVAPPGNSTTSGVYNFYSVAAKLGCGYADRSPKCIAAVISGSAETFGDKSICRGIVHFNAIYFTAVALGFKQDVAYMFSAFSQGIDFVQYQGIDSCGREMPNRYTTPPLRGLMRTAATYGGTNRHLGVPFVGWLDKSPLYNTTSGEGAELVQRNKTYTGGSGPLGCLDKFFTSTWDQYVKRCPALMPDLSDNFYEGALASGRRWAFGETNIICNGGFTVPDKKNKDSVFTGSACPPPTSGRQYTVNVGPAVSGPIPLTGSLQFGEQVVHYDCTPNCTAAPTAIVPESVILASKLGQYLNEQSQAHGYATMDDGTPVPELVARMGVYLHWIADRASHFYCTDASGSGVAAVKNGTGYDLYLYLETKACNFVTHGMVHYWEQGVAYLAPGTYSALLLTYRELLAFRRANLIKHPEWFRPCAKANSAVLSEKLVVGTYSEPGILFNMTLILEADKRMEAEIEALRQYNLPPMPGFETMCKE
eukprot:Colp12_sorted_trinity150504_noHs@23989